MWVPKDLQYTIFWSFLPWKFSSGTLGNLIVGVACNNSGDPREFFSGAGGGVKNTTKVTRFGNYFMNESGFKGQKWSIFSKISSQILNEGPFQLTPKEYFKEKILVGCEKKTREKIGQNLPTSHCHLSLDFFPDEAFSSNHWARKIKITSNSRGLFCNICLNLRDVFADLQIYSSERFQLLILLFPP